MQLDNTCNIETYGDCRLSYFSSDLDSLYWELKLDENGNCGEKMMLVPQVYEQDTRLRATMGVCGYMF